MRQARYEEAARHAEREARSGSDSDEFWLTQQAKALVRGNNFKAALEIAQQALDRDPSNPYAVAVTADALVGLDLPEKALMRYEEILPRPRLARKGRNGVLQCLSTLKRWEELLQRVESWSLPEADALSWKVKAFGATAREEEALEACRRWLELKPHHPPALWERTELEIRTQGMETVLEKMGRLVRIRSLPKIYGEIYPSLCRRAGRPDGAIKTYERLGLRESRSRSRRRKSSLWPKAAGKEKRFRCWKSFSKVPPMRTFTQAMPPHVRCFR